MTRTSAALVVVDRPTRTARQAAMGRSTLRAAVLAAALVSLPTAATATLDGGVPPAAAGVEHGKAATADASPVDPGVVEAEAAWAPVWNLRGGSRGFSTSEDGHVHLFSGTVTVGVLPDVDVKVQGAVGTIYDAAHAHADGSAPKRGTGLADAVVGARWRFLNLPEQALELAVTADATLPVGASHTPARVGLTQDFWSARGALVATKDFGPLTANAELAAAVPVSGDAGGLRTLLQANAAVGYQLLSWLQPELELNWQSAVGQDGRMLAVTAGVVAPFGDGHRVVAAVQQGIWGENVPQTAAAVLAFKTGW